MGPFESNVRVDAGNRIAQLSILRNCGTAMCRGAGLAEIEPVATRLRKLRRNPRDNFQRPLRNEVE